MMYDPKFPMEIEGSESTFIFKMYTYWRKGIACHLFRKDAIRDIENMMAIETAVGTKNKKDTQVNSMIANARMGR